MASDRKKSSKKVWLAVGVIVLIVLLIVWLTIADLWGDTDVAACIPPVSMDMISLLP